MQPGLRQPPPLLIVISGPSGAGKDVIVARMKERGLPFHFTITATTRPPRDYEVEGLHYYFRSLEEFNRMQANDELLEHAVVYGNYYGPPKAGVRAALDRGEDAVLRIDVQGASHIRSKIPEAVFIFIAPDSYEEIIQRLKSRATESPKDLAVRLSTYEQEMRASAYFDYLIINRDGQLDATVDTIAAILVAEKNRVSPRRIEI